MKFLSRLSILVAAAALAAPCLAQPAPPASFKRVTPDQKRQLGDLLKAPGLKLAAELDLPVTFECEQDFRRAVADFRRAVSACASLESPAPGSPIDKYNKGSASQQFATCGSFADEFTCFRDKLVPEQQAFCQKANASLKSGAERTRAICVAKECAKLSLRIKAAEAQVRSAEQQVADLNKKIADSKKAIADAQKDKQQARCN